MLTGRKLPLTLAFGVLLALTLGVGCQGFFVKPTLTSITINPSSPSVQVGNSRTLSAFGVNSENQGSTLTGGVSWSSSNPAVAIITGTCATEPCGIVTIQGVTSGQSTITASAQSVTNSTALTVFLGSVTNYQVCQGTFGATTACSSGGTPLTWTVTGANGGQQTFIAQGTSNGTLFDLTTGSTWTLSSNPAAGSISCTNTGASPETCTVAQNTTIGTYNVTVTYPPNTVATLQIKVQ